jgi:hypothetical protein
MLLLMLHLLCFWVGRWLYEYMLTGFTALKKSLDSISLNLLIFYFNYQQAEQKIPHKCF